MAGIDQRHTEYLCQHGGNVAGIRVVAVDDIRNTLLFLNEPDGFVDIFIQVRPQRLFAHVLAPPALDAHDTARVTHSFDRLGVVLGNAVIQDQACKQVHLLHVLALAERSGQLDDVYDLPTGVRIPAKLHVFSPQQPMNAE